MTKQLLILAVLALRSLSGISATGQIPEYQYEAEEGSSDAQLELAREIRENGLKLGDALYWYQCAKLSGASLERDDLQLFEISPQSLLSSVRARAQRCPTSLRINL